MASCSTFLSWFILCRLTSDCRTLPSLVCSLSLASTVNGSQLSPTLSFLLSTGYSEKRLWFPCWKPSKSCIASGGSPLSAFETNHTNQRSLQATRLNIQKGDASTDWTLISRTLLSFCLRGTPALVFALYLAYNPTHSFSVFRYCYLLFYPTLIYCFKIVYSTGPHSLLAVTTNWTTSTLLGGCSKIFTKSS
jgi:hypothetical protein